MTASKAARTTVAVGLAGVDRTNMRRPLELVAPGPAGHAMGSRDWDDAWARQWTVRAVAADALRRAIPPNWR